MKDIMIDIETLGHPPNAVLLNISAVQFDIETGKRGSVFNMNVNPEDCYTNHKGAIEFSTLQWWLPKRRTLVGLLTDQYGAEYAIGSLDLFIRTIRQHSDEQVWIWANSPTFDLSILRHYFKTCNIDCPWQFYEEMDVRTLNNLFPEFRKMTEWSGAAHNGVDDCLFQIKYLSKIWNEIKHRAIAP